MSYISSATTIAYVDVRNNSKTVFLPSTFNIAGKLVTVKDIFGSSGSNTITIATVGGDVFENGLSNQQINQQFGATQFVAQRGIWYTLNTFGSGNPGPGISSLSSIISHGLSSLRTDPGISSLSSLVSHGLSSLRTDPGISSLSSIVSYGLSSLGRQVVPGLSSLSSIVSYGLSSLRTDPGLSSLSSIVSYGLSSLGGQVVPGLSSLSSIVSYGLSSLITDPGLSSLSSIVSYGLSSLGGQVVPGLSSLSSIVSYGLSSLGGQVAPGLSSLSSIVSYGLSSLGGQVVPGLSSLSSIVSYGLSSLGGQVAPGLSSISSIVSYGLSTLRTDTGISSLSSIVSYGLSTLRTDPGISSLSSIVSYGLSTLRTDPGISSLSSIVSYGLSTLRTDPGISSLSSIVSYGLSSLRVDTGISSLSSIVSYGLSSLQIDFQSISTLSSILSYGLSSINVESGLSSFSTSIGSTFRTNTLYVFSNVGVRCNIPAYPLDVNGSIQGKLASNSIGNFSAGALGGAGILDAKCNAPDTYVDSIYKLDSWIFQNIVTKPPAPTGLTATATKSNISVSWTNPVLYSIGLFNTFVPNITTLFVNISNTINTINQTLVLSNQSNLPMYPFAVQGADFFNVGTFNNNIVSKNSTYYITQTNTNITFPNGPYNITVYFSNHNVTPQIPINFVTALDLNLLTVGAPSAPRNISITSSTPNSITFSWSSPQFSDATDGTDTITLHDYRLISSNTTLTGGGYPRRYPGNIYDTNSAVTTTIPFSGGTQTTVVTGLFPDNPYSGRIAARNVINTNYGIFSNYFTSFRTALPTEPSRLNNATLSESALTPNQGTYRYTPSGIRAGTRNSDALTVYNLANINSQGGFKFSLTGLAIHSAQTPGVSNVDISRIIGSNSNGATAFFSNSGFLDTSSYSAPTQNNITITRNNVRDFYGSTAGYTGFYQIADYIVSFGQSLFSASQIAIPLFISQSNLSNTPTTQTNSFYIDDLATSVSVNLLSNIGVTSLPTNYITGVASYAIGDILNNYIDFNNIGKNFLIHSRFGQYSLRVSGVTASSVIQLDSTNTIPTPIYNTANVLYSSGVLPNPARIQAQNAISGNVFTSSSADLQMNIVGSNINSTSVNVNCNVLYYHPTLGPLKLYLDLPSIAVLNATAGAGGTNGVRVLSGIGTTNPVNYGGTFQQRSNLATEYVNELQLSGGIYLTKAAAPNDAYRNYSSYYGNNSINYSGIASDSTIRFATFKYTRNRSGAATGTIAISISYIGAITFPLTSGLFDGGILLQYKIDSYKDSAGNNISDPNPTPSALNQTTVWLNGNAVLPVSGFDLNSWNTPTYPGLNTTSYTNTVSNRYLTIRQGNYNNMDIYIRVGIPMNAAYAFKGISILGFF